MRKLQAAMQVKLRRVFAEANTERHAIWFNGSLSAAWQVMNGHVECHDYQY